MEMGIWSAEASGSGKWSNSPGSAIFSPLSSADRTAALREERERERDSEGEWAEAEGVMDDDDG